MSEYMWQYTGKGEVRRGTFKVTKDIPFQERIERLLPEIGMGWKQATTRVTETSIVFTVPGGTLVVMERKA